MKSHAFFATCPKGLELLLEEELIALGATQTKQTVAGVTFHGDLETAYNACLWSRLANRVLLPLSQYRVTDADSLYHGAQKIAWEEHLANQASFRVDFTGTSDEIINSHFAAQKVKDAIVDRLRTKNGQRPSVDRHNPDLRINAVLKKGAVTISIDFSGESLHKRGYRVPGAAAPLKENLAAAILLRANWKHIAQAGGCLVDPMCGTGTLVIEALLMAADIAPGLWRKRFGFQGWKKYNPAVWEPLVQAAQLRSKQGKKGLLANFYGFDMDPEAVWQAQACISRINLDSFVTFQQRSLKQLSIHDIKKTHGLCIVNPPYGERLEEQENLLPLYRLLATKLKEDFLNWEAGVITGNPDVAKRMGLRAYKKYALFNGTIACDLLLFHVKPEWFINPSRD